MGTRYVAALPAGKLPDLPPATQTAIITSVTSFLTQDRGHIRLGNGGSADSHFVFYALWLDAMQFDQQSAAALTEAQTLQLFGFENFVVQVTPISTQLMHVS
jgi:hypothetical protein